MYEYVLYYEKLCPKGTFLNGKKEATRVQEHDMAEYL